MKTPALKKILIGLIAASLSTGFASAQSMSFTVTTKSSNGSTGSVNVFALWITNSAGAYVKTINRQSKNYTSSLTNWFSNSANKATDGTTGATLPSHNYAYTSTAKTTKRIPFTWNFKNYLGALMPDGTYFINIEFKEENTSRQYVKYSFTKGATNYTTTPMGTMMSGTASCFTNPSLVYTAPAVALTTTEVTNFDFTYNRSDRNLQLEYDPASHSDIKLQLVNLKGQTLYSTALKGTGKESTLLPNCTPGIYMIRLTDNNGWSQTRKLML